MKIRDFGLARDMDGSDSRSEGPGNSRFRAPEVNGKYYDKSCDVWSFGIIIGDLCKVNREV
jgi:serine/threonine protein kinase